MAKKEKIYKVTQRIVLSTTVTIVAKDRGDAEEKASDYSSSRLIETFCEDEEDDISFESIEATGSSFLRYID